MLNNNIKEIENSYDEELANEYDCLQGQYDATKYEIRYLEMKLRREGYGEEGEAIRKQIKELKYDLNLIRNEMNTIKSYFAN